MKRMTMFRSENGRDLYIDTNLIESVSPFDTENKALVLTEIQMIGGHVYLVTQTSSQVLSMIEP